MNTEPNTPAQGTNLNGMLKNPLAIFGLILVAGDGPLVVAYILASDPHQSWVLLISTILFVFGMGAFFCYLVSFKPMHLYAPGEIPDGSIGKNLYNTPEPSGDYLENAKKLIFDLTKSSSDEQKSSLVRTINSQLDSATDIQIAHDLLLMPGYDVSVILDILQSIQDKKCVDSLALSVPRNVTASTIDVIIEQMQSKHLISKKFDLLYLTEKGIRISKSIHSYLNS